MCVFVSTFMEISTYGSLNDGEVGTYNDGSMGCVHSLVVSDGD